MDRRITIFREAQKEAQKERMANGRDILYDEKINKYSDINYRKDGNPRHMLDLYTPKNGELFPVIVEIHGGGYIANEKEVTSVHAKYFASRGFGVVNADYTLFPEADFATELREMADVFEWIYKNGSEYNLDTNRIYLTGDSAGGHLVLLYAMLQGNCEMQEYFGVKMPHLKVRAVAPTCPAFRFRLNPELNECEGMNFFYDILFPSGADSVLLDMLDVAVLAGKSDFPPLIITTTPYDTLLYSDDMELKEVLDGTGKEAVYSICESKTHELSHVFNVLFPEWEESIEANEKIIEFFNKH